MSSESDSESTGNHVICDVLKPVTNAIQQWHEWKRNNVTREASYNASLATLIDGWQAQSQIYEQCLEDLREESLALRDALAVSFMIYATAVKGVLNEVQLRSQKPMTVLCQQYPLENFLASEEFAYLLKQVRKEASHWRDTAKEVAIAVYNLRE